jgi:two-component system, NarL family, sensor histidine kinase UhpB
MQRGGRRTRLASDAHRQAILSNIPDQAWLKDIDSRYVAVNEAYVKACGVPEERILGRLPNEVWRSSIAAQYLASDRKVLATGTRQRFEEQRPNRRGQMRCYETIKTPVRDRRGRIIGTAGISRDITHRKKLEGELRKSRGRLRELSAHLHSVREEERARLSRELHDELGQNLTALRFGLDWLDAQLLAGQDQLAAKVVALRALTDATIATMARIATDLRPIILDDLGLAVAVEWLVETVAKQSGLDIALSSTLERDPAERDTDITVFRILQESLTNIVRHAKATKVQVTLSTDGRSLALEVADDGCGFAASLRQNRTPALGLLGMEERAAAAGGVLTIESAPGRGTRIVLRVPRRRPARRRSGMAA